MSAPAIPRVVLIAPTAFEDGPSALEAARAIGNGLSAYGWACDLCPLEESIGVDGGEAMGSALDRVGWDQRMRRAHAVILGAGRVDRHMLAGSLFAEAATRARQAGVPCYAIVGEDALDSFDKRVLDLDLVLEARTVAELERAATVLAGLL